MDVNNEIFQPFENIRERSHCPSLDMYRKMYDESLKDPPGFWGKLADDFITWKTRPKPELFFQYNFDVNKGNINIKWMQGGITNVCYNVLDRHIENGLGEKIAIYWEGNDPNDDATLTYNELLTEVCKFANVLKSRGVKAGDRVSVYMPMIPQLLIAMLACARIGAIHSLVFGGFSADALAERILDAQCEIIITTDGTWRGTKLLDLKKIADAALKICSEKEHQVRTCIVVRHILPEGQQGVGDGNPTPTPNGQPGKRPVATFKVNWVEGRDYWWQSEMKNASKDCEPAWLDAEHPLFMLYTSGSTGKPKGVLHTCAGYLLYVATTFKYVFDHQIADDVFWCTADLGWITGHSYVCYGPLANGASSVMFEGTPFYPDGGRFWQVCDKYQVTKFYTAPTAIRSLMKLGDEPVRKHKRESLKILGTVGEPINPEAWLWYHRIVGDSRCGIVDTYWQTETGGIVIVPLPGAIPTKPGSATFPFFGVVPELLTEEGKVIEGVGEGYLVFKQPWPGLMRTVFGNHERFEVTYFKKFPGYYCTGDGARRDADGYLWLTGRIDDMLNVSGHLLSTAEVESALIEHPSVAETAAVAHPHSIKGECLYCFVTLRDGKIYNEELETELKNIVRKKIGPFAQPDFIQEAPALPKTRSGKIMRRILRKIAIGDRDVGDTTTLMDESVVDQLFELRPKDA